MTHDVNPFPYLTREVQSAHGAEDVPALVVAEPPFPAAAAAAAAAPLLLPRSSSALDVGVMTSRACEDYPTRDPCLLVVWVRRATKAKTL